MNIEEGTYARLCDLGVSKRTIDRIDDLVAQRDDYAYTGGEVADKHFIAFVGATRVGKSTSINPMLEMGRQRGIDIAEVGSSVTRGRRPSDPADYITADEGHNHDRAVDLIENGQMLNWSLFKTGHIYGGQPQNFDSKYNLQPFLPDSLDMMRRAGFATLKTVYVVAPTNEWRSRFTEPVDDPDTRNRLLEALDSLEFGMNQPDLIRYVNQPGEEALKKASSTLLNIVLAEDNEARIRVLESRISSGYYLHGQGMKNAALEMLDEN